MAGTKAIPGFGKRSSMSKYLLTGGSGTLGTELQKYLDCFAPDSRALDVRRSAYELAQYKWHDRGSPIHNFLGIIHCAAFTDVLGAEIYKQDAITTNIFGTKNIMDLGRIWEVPVVYISTDYVYPGTRGNYSETDNTEAFNFYGFTKLAGEVFATPDDLVIRTSFKPIDLWTTKYKKAFLDVYTSADYVDIIAQDIAFSIHSNLKGVYNIGTGRKSIYSLARLTNLSVEQMSRSDVADVKLPYDISMNIDKYTSFKNSHIEKFKTFIGEK